MNLNNLRTRLERKEGGPYLHIETPGDTSTSLCGIHLTDDNPAGTLGRAIASILCRSCLLAFLRLAPGFKRQLGATELKEES